MRKEGDALQGARAANWRVSRYPGEVLSIRWSYVEQMSEDLHMLLRRHYA